MAITKRRGPLTELPLVDFVPEPNGAVRPRNWASPSTLQGTHKRGPPTPSKDHTPSSSTLKRRAPFAPSAASECTSEVALNDDELGIGKSPARRLFVNEPTTPQCTRASTYLAPSPPLASNGESISMSETTRPSSSRRIVHDCGFAVFVDEVGGHGVTSSPTPLATASDCDPQSRHDQENIPPSQLESSSQPAVTNSNYLPAQPAVFRKA